MENFTFIQNILLGLTLAAPIGPVNVEIIRRGLNSGFRQAILTGAGAMCADATYLTLIFFGLTAFLNNAAMKIFLGVAGSFILMYLGILSVKDFFGKTTSRFEPPRRLFKSPFIAGLALAISSPMTIVWWTGVFGALLSSQTPLQSGISAFCSCLSILLGCFIWVFFLACALHWVKRLITEKITGVISLVAGIFLIGFGIYFLCRTALMMS